MRLGIMMGALLLAPCGLAQGGGVAGHASGHASGVARSSAGASAMGRSGGFAGRSARLNQAAGLGGYAHRGFGGGPAYGYGYGGGSGRYGWNGYGRSRSYGYGYAPGLYAGYGLGDALASDVEGYDNEGLSQPYGVVDAADGGPSAPPFLAQTGYGPGYDIGPGPPAFAQGVHDTGEGAYAYGYSGYAETPALPYGAPAEDMTGYPVAWAASTCGC